MTTTLQPNAEGESLGRDILYALRYYLGGRRGFLILAAVALIGGLAFNWNWLAAVGVAPLILAVAPCAVMCAFGLCMNRMTGGSCKSNQAGNTTETGGETALPNGAENNLVPNETGRNAQTVSVVSSRYSQSQTNQPRNTTDD